MKLLIFFLFPTCILLESTLVPIPLTLFCIILISSFWEEEIEIWAFLAGIFLDLFVPRLLGIDSIFFLGVVFLSRRYRKKMHSGQFIFLASFFLLIITVYSLIFYKNLGFFQLVILATTSGSLLLLTRKFLGEAGNKKRLVV